MSRPSLGIIGAGNVGTALALLLSRAGYEVRAVFSRTESRAQRLVEAVGGQAVTSAAAVVEAADLILLTVPDDVVAAVALSLQDSEWSGKGAAHTAGALDAACLDVLAARGAMTGSFHPAFPFAGFETALAGLPRSVFAVEARTVELQRWLIGMADALSGRWLVIPEGQKALYHCALVIASNYLVTLYALAERMLQALGAERQVVSQALNALVQATVDNLREQGIPQALTGPLTRADVGTVRAHLNALAAYDRDVLMLYRLLAQVTVPLVAQRGLPTEWIDALIHQEE